MKNIIYTPTNNSNSRLSAFSLRLVGGMSAGSAEFFGGVLLIIDLLVRPTGLVPAITMLVATFALYINNGLFMSANGYEFSLSLFAITIALMFKGAGKYSLDALINNNQETTHGLNR